ncbi:transmembrane protein, partial [Cystoisospora suis]
LRTGFREPVEGSESVSQLLLRYSGCCCLWESNSLQLYSFSKVDCSRSGIPDFSGQSVWPRSNYPHFQLSANCDRRIMAPSLNTPATEPRQKQSQPTSKHGSEATPTASCAAAAPPCSPVSSVEERIRLKKEDLPSAWSCSETCVWLTFLCACGVGYTFFSDGEVSALLTLSAAFYTLATVFALYHTRVCGSMTTCVVYDKPGAGKVPCASLLV